MIAYAFLTKTPNHTLIDFAQRLYDKYKYDIYIFIDDDSFQQKTLSTDINFIKIDKNDCINKNICYCVEWSMDIVFQDQGNRKVYALDKSLYYFAYINKKYDFIWLIEDDVFIPSLEALYNIDTRYQNSDLLCANNDKCHPHQENEWFWPFALKCFEHPVYCSMLCCCRISAQLLDKITNYSLSKGFVPLHEFSFNTLAMQNNLQVDCPQELSTIFCKQGYKWTIQDFKDNPNNLFHPLKDFDNHEYYRSCI